MAALLILQSSRSAACTACAACQLLILQRSAWAQLASAPTADSITAADVQQSAQPLRQHP